ncbi:MAG TPA: hypothetical protein VMT52_15230, partial [Planctomycetota bacterium]|nr:hypothetical protein [Planctomycetota bacterium]
MTDDKRSQRETPGGPGSGPPGGGGAPGNTPQKDPAQRDLLQKDGEQTALGPRRFRLGLLYVVLLIIAVFSMKRLFDPEGVE